MFWYFIIVGHVFTIGNKTTSNDKPLLFVNFNAEIEIPQLFVHMDEQKVNNEL